MTPHTPGAVSQRRLLPHAHFARFAAVRAIFAVVPIVAVTACAIVGANPVAHDVAASPSVDITGAPSPTGTVSATPSTSPRTTPRATAVATLTLTDYLALLPTFPAAPAPVAVALPHGAGRASWVSRIPTTQPVAFLTIDDGIVKTPAAIDLLKAAGIPVTLFLTTNFINANTGYFTKLQSEGAVIEDHTVSHPDLIRLDYTHQKTELCHSTDLLATWYGRRPVIFRPPFGDKNDDTLRAAWDCGLKAGFFWKETVDKGVVRYQTALHKIQPGDIILMHFRPAFAADFTAALKAIKAAGLTPALLEDYVLVN